MARVGVVIPAFNPGSYLRETIASVLGQTFSDWELLVVDDGSTEDLSFVERLDGRIRRLRQANQGLSAARNNGVAELESELVAFLDADDLWHPEKLARQVELFDTNSEVSLCFTDFELINSGGESIGKWDIEVHTSYLDLLTECSVCVSTVVMRRSLFTQLGGFEPRYRSVNDWDLWLRAAQLEELGQIREVLCGYRMHDRNMSKNYRLAVREATTIMRSHRKTGREAGLSEIVRASKRGQQWIRRSAGSMAFDDFSTTHRISSFVDALRFAPRSTLSTVIRHHLPRRLTTLAR